MSLQGFVDIPARNNFHFYQCDNTFIIYTYNLSASKASWAFNRLILAGPLNIPLLFNTEKININTFVKGLVNLQKYFF